MELIRKGDVCLSKKRKITPEDLYKIKSVADPRLSPDGKKCVYVETRLQEDNDGYSSNLFYLDMADKGPSRQWTFGADRNHSPRWSPDGSKIAFVSNRSGKDQIYMLHSSGGEARKLTACKNGARNPVWSPTGEEIAFTASLKMNESVMETEENIKEKETVVPLEVDIMKYKSDSSGFWEGKNLQIAIVSIETGAIRQLTDGRTDYHLQSWSPSGQWIAATADMAQNRDLSFNSHVLLIHAETKEIDQLTNESGQFGSVTFSPDGKYIGFIGHKREHENATLSKLWTYNTETKGISCLTEEMDLLTGDYAIGDIQQGAVTPGVLWSYDSSSFYFLASDRGNTVIYFGNLDGEFYPALLDQQHVYGFSLDAQNQKIVAAISRPSLPGELFLLDVPSGSLEQMTAVNESFMNEVILSEPEETDFMGKDGASLHGWLMKPIEVKQGEKYPLVLEIHGGPHMMYANSYFHEFQILAAQGFSVLYTNPRGSHGYGQAHVDAVRGDYGGSDYDDIMSAVDYAVKTFNLVDSSRLGVTGGSYGGFMTNWIIGRTNRFKAAVTQRSISNWVSFYGVSDIGYYFSEWQMKAGLSDIKTLWKHSPLAYAENINTPLLIMHGEKDLRCPIEQAEQLFISLKRQNKQVKFIRFPEANHELSRSGRPSLRIHRLNYIADWFKQHLN